MDWKTKLGFGMGHVLNDLCASMWFTYLLVFFSKVLYFDNTYAGVILLVGQLADGVSTTFVGLMSDKPDNIWLCRKYGRRKSWHLVGTVCVMISFPFIFHSCLGCKNADEWAQVIYYSAFAVIFQFGWASCQISHLALIPALAEEASQRTSLTAVRYSMTVVSNIIVYLVALAFFGFNSSDSKLCAEDETSFLYIVLIVIGLGAVASLMFHLLVKEDADPPSNRGQEESDNPAEAESKPEVVPPVPVLFWFKVPAFYGVAVLYMSTRLFVNLSQAYIPLYIQESLELTTVYIAIIPLVMFVAGFLTSILINLLNKCMSRKVGGKWTYLAGAIIGVVACVLTFALSGENRTSDFFLKYGIFFVAVLYGSCSSIILVTSLALTAQLIGENSSSAAFVYGAMSFTDKVSNGIAVVLVQKFIPCEKCIEAAFKWYFRDVLFYVVGGSVLLGGVTSIVLHWTQIAQLRPQQNGTTRQNNQDEATERTPLLSNNSSTRNSVS